jgi:prepilin-type processing-associated H-X9-DG protein
LKQIALGFAQYTQDYDERLPLWFANLDGTAVATFNPVTTGAGGPGIDQGWAELLQPYLRSTQIFQCPSETGAPAAAGSNSTGYTDYMYNGDISSYSANTGPGLSLSAIEYPSNTVLNADATSNHSASVFGGNYAWGPPYALSYYTRHLEGANISFVDGHVKWLKPEKVASRTSTTCGAGNPGSPPIASASFCYQ